MLSGTEIQMLIQLIKQCRNTQISFTLVLLVVDYNRLLGQWLLQHPPFLAVLGSFDAVKEYWQLGQKVEQGWPPHSLSHSQEDFVNVTLWKAQVGCHPCVAEENFKYTQTRGISILKNHEYTTGTGTDKYGQAQILINPKAIVTSHLHDSLSHNTGPLLLFTKKE